MAVTHDALAALFSLFIVGFTAITAYAVGYRNGDREGRRMEWRHHREGHICVKIAEAVRDGRRL